MRIHADQREVSPTGEFRYFMSCSGLLYRIDYAVLFDASLSDAALAAKVEMFPTIVRERKPPPDEPRPVLPRSPRRPAATLVARPSQASRLKPLPAV